MSESILEASKKSKGNGFLKIFKKKSIIIILILIIAVVGVWYFVASGKDKQSNIEKKQSEWTVKKDDIKISIESDGKVVAKDGVELSFSVSGDTLEVVETFFDEGDMIKKGDKIARVKADSLELNVRSAYASYQSALASYNDKLDGADNDETVKAENSITQAEISLEQAKVSLERMKANVEDTIESAQEGVDNAKDDLDYDFEDDYQKTINKEYDDLIGNLKSVIISMDDILRDSDAIIGIDDTSINDDFESYLGARNVETIYKSAGTYTQSKNAYLVLNSKVIVLSDFSDEGDVDKVGDEALIALDFFENHLYEMQQLLASTITSSGLSQSSLNTFISTINSNRSNINTKISNLNADIKSVNDANDALIDYRDNYDDNLNDYQEAYNDALQNLEDVIAEGQRDLIDAENSVKTKELDLDESKLDYEDLLSPLSNSELASAKSQLTSASVSLQKANNELEEATLISPIDGEVALLNYKTGDTIISDNSKIVVSIINNDTLFIEVDIEEADINNLEVGQKAIATFDALNELEIEGEISFISLTSSTNNNGIVTYLVRVLFENSSDANVREGMTAYVDFITGSVSDVLVIPVEAVRNVEGKPSVQFASGEWMPVTTGFTDGDDVEVISGLNKGDKIVY